MFGFVTFMVIWVLIGFGLVRYAWVREGKEEAFCITLGYLLLGGMVNVMLAMIISMVFGCWNTMEFQVKEVHPIVSLRNGDQTHGSFFLGCGTVGTTEYYYFMYDLGGGRYLRDSVPTSNVVIQETTTEKPSYTVSVWKEQSPKWVASWWIPSLIPHETQKRDYTLNVPPGTVIQRFEIK